MCNVKNKKLDKQMTVSLSHRDCKSLREDYHNGPFYSSPDFPSCIIAIRSYLSLPRSFSLRGKIDGWNILRNMRIKAKEGNISEAHHNEWEFEGC